MAETLAEIKCISKDIKELILKRFKHDRKFNPDMDILCSSIESAPSCESEIKGTIKVKKGKRKTERSTFMGQCMRKKEKGGMGNDMSSCSTIFKGMNAEERKKYTPKE